MIEVRDGELIVRQWTRFSTEYRREDDLVIEVEIDGVRHRRTFPLSVHLEEDRDLRIAGGYWRHGEHLVETLGETPAALRARMVDRCLAVETVFPHLRDRLPA